MGGHGASCEKRFGQPTWKEKLKSVLPTLNKKIKKELTKLEFDFTFVEMISKLLMSKNMHE